MSTPDKQMMQKPKGSSAGMWAAVAVVLIVIVLVVVGFEAGWFGTKANNNNNNNNGNTQACTVPSGQTLTAAGSNVRLPPDVYLGDGLHRQRGHLLLGG